MKILEEVVYLYFNQLVTSEWQLDGITFVIDALKRSSAKTITAVFIFGYARQDRKVAPRTSISSKVVANLLTNAGANRIVTVDLLSQIQGFWYDW